MSLHFIKSALQWKRFRKNGINQWIVVFMSSTDEKSPTEMTVLKGAGYVVKIDPETNEQSKRFINKHLGEEVDVFKKTMDVATLMRRKDEFCLVKRHENNGNGHILVFVPEYLVKAKKNTRKNKQTKAS